MGYVLVLCLVPISGVCLDEVGSRESTETTPRALALLSRHPATQMGMDRLGNAWAWNERSGKVVIVPSDGAPITQEPRVRGAQELAVDQEWGVVALVSDGRELRLWPAQGGTPRSMVLPDPAGDACWVDHDRVAVSPRLTEHRVQIIDLANQRVVRSFGQEEETVPGPGAVRARFVHLVADHPRQRLITLDSFTGSLEVYDLDGTLQHRAALQPPGREAVLAWLEELDRSARATGETRVQTVLSLPSMAVDRTGSLWTVADADSSTLTLLEATPGGTVRQHTVGDGGCPGRFVLIEQGWFLFYRPLDHPDGFCAATRRMP